MSYIHEIFPDHNRGKQSVAMCYTALAYVKRFAVSKFKNVTVDVILKYGDRLHAATRRIEYNKLKRNKELGLTDQEIEERLNKIDWGIYDVATAFCIGVDQMQAEVSPDIIKGELYANESQEILDVKRGLTSYLDENRSGILTAKDLTVAVWRGANVYFMFDPNSRVPNGVQCVNGEACITRYLNLNVLVDVFLKNLSKRGKNSFKIHKVKIRIVPCPREPKSEEIERTEVRPKYNGYNMVMPGKSILRGTMSQDDPVFGRERNAQCAAVAIVALTMTLIHKASIWTKPIIDEILVIGDELYIATLDTLGFQFNPWEQGMTVYLVNKDYKMGTLKANCELRTMDQRGIIDIKHPKVLNLRQGIENFFQENTYGVIETEVLTVVIWEKEDQPT
ncbi:hypothetical protein ILUMI_25857 [Ignelater luminosus]|uniref:Uncharacterized protein n=1 Tax=Ignelater luminosus TaxID=2038154 RepID=A0A8K0CAU8_IGNLU|nr:hypothetical protein ILUMI_25857 [Ignelater luminosus]